MESIAAAAPAIAMLGAFACIAGGIHQVTKGGDRRRGILLLVMAAVLIANVLIWTM